MQIVWESSNADNFLFKKKTFFNKKHLPGDTKSQQIHSHTKQHKKNCKTLKR